jgi:hypothetical protein
VRNATHKLIRRFDETPVRDELYDLINDAFEQNDLLLAVLDPVAQAAYDALSVEMDAVRDTSGRIEGYGAAQCAGSNGNPAIGWSGVPAIGSSYDVWVTAAAAQQHAVLVLGQSNTLWAGLSLPFPFEQIGGGPGCLLYASAETTLAAATDASGTAALTVQVPHQLALVAGTYYHTWVIFDPLAPGNALGITTSDAAAVTIGSPL